MKRVLAVAGSFLALAALAAVAWPGGASAVDPSGVGAVAVIGSGVVTSTPDTARLSAGVETNAASARAALAGNADEARRVIAALRRAGATNIATESVILNPRTLPDGRVDGFVAQNTVSATVAVAAAGAAIDAAVDAGANVVWGPALSSSDAETLYRKALTKAVADARARAELLAGAAGRTLGEVTAIVESGADRPQPFADKVEAAGSPIEPGTQEIAASVSVTYELR